MITIKDLKQIDSIKKEIKYLDNKLKKIEEKPIKIVQDSVSSSSREFPYTRHTTVIEGFETPKNKRKYKKLINNAKYRLEKNINHLEYELEKIEDSEIRMIIRYKYEEGLNYIQIAHRMNESENKIYTEEGIRKKFERFFKNL